MVIRDSIGKKIEGYLIFPNSQKKLKCYYDLHFVASVINVDDTKLT